MNKRTITNSLLLVLLVTCMSGCGNRVVNQSAASLSEKTAQYSTYRSGINDGQSKIALPPPQSYEEDSIYMARSIAMDIAVSKIGPQLFELFLTSENVNCYRLMYADEVVNTYQAEPNFVRVTEPKSLSKNDIDRLLSELVLHPGAYTRDEQLRIEAPYLPFCEIEFAGTDNRAVSLLISPADRTWSIANGGVRLANYDIPDPDQTLPLCLSLIKE